MRGRDRSVGVGAGEDVVHQGRTGRHHGSGFVEGYHRVVGRPGRIQHAARRLVVKLRQVVGDQRAARVVPGTRADAIAGVHGRRRQIRVPRLGAQGRRHRRRQRLAKGVRAVETVEIATVGHPPAGHEETHGGAGAATRAHRSTGHAAASSYRPPGSRCGATPPTNTGTGAGPATGTARAPGCPERATHTARAATRSGRGTAGSAGSSRGGVATCPGGNTAGSRGSSAGPRGRASRSIRAPAAAGFGAT